MSQPITAFLQTVCEQIRTKKAHRSVRRELEGHIADLVEELMAEGMERQEAERVAVARMGDARDIGRQLNEVHKPVIEWGLIGIVATMLGLGLFYMYVLDLRMGTSFTNTDLFADQVLFAVIGIILAGAIWLYDYRSLARKSWLLYALAVVLMLYTAFLAPAMNGSRVFIALPFGSIHAMMAVMFLLIVSNASVTSVREWTFQRTGAELLARVVVPIVFFAATNAFVLLALYLSSSLVQLWILRISWQQKLVTTASGLSAMTLLALLKPYHLERFLSQIFPSAEGENFVVSLLSAHIKEAGWFGNGPVALDERLAGLHSEGLFSVMIHTYGWLMGIGFSALVLTFIVRAAIIGSKVRDPFGKLLIAGLVSIMGLQFVWSILMSLGWAPFAGVSMPLVSYGGNSMLLHMLAIGLILSVAKQQRVSSGERSSSLVGKRA
ncbi:hypothetical protein PA598K_00212 [Paenibacillus sp. 598K]|nr:hypothetical protein PA598K_00212 [Paenibacillus sp. 598K]